MTPADLQTEFLARLAAPFTGEALFDCLPDVVYFIKDARARYVVVNQTVVERCGFREKRDLLGKRADEAYPPPYGQRYRAQDEEVLRTGEPILNRLELQLYPTGGPGWCVTHKLPLRGRRGEVAGLVGVSKDLHAPGEEDADYPHVAEAVRRIQTGFEEPLKVRDLAALAGLSRYQFEQRMRRIFQITAGQFIQKTRMDAAVRRLRETDMPIAAVALACGYSDQSAFSRQFKQAVGLSPAEYRRVSRGPV
ncbi:MAG TPA: AraC family transcriptional regulator [Planctomycetota bacterium]|jgi:AraC-like DNA-binding protein|nr:AraC family transcriptional regulator [Planctomycetota bacterium]OQC21327.1 MAG: Regulatory protein SoxS [Planctomycetes bacterium ADurb.Bin069]NMD35742.1 AraC family transcriptional regulator [Planctomycetota bacterium]HNR99658.1 AraC family transcriptional regulator [Planctomycetota bacterium]HNU25214.1 AraC family transcriptional regulator [Planctomycetota bacterium]